MKPELRLKFSDFWPGFEPSRSFLVRTLQERYEVRFDAKADILVYSPYGTSHVTHRGTKVLVTAEPWPLPEGAFDYCISSYPATEERLYVPVYQWDLLERPELDQGLARRLDPAEWAARPNFCNFVYANEGAPERASFFRALSTHRFVHAPGAQCNNSPPLPGGRYAPDYKQVKLDYQSSFRFSIAFENTFLAGYTTEKLLDALAAGTIPIYWGNPDASDAFAAGSFIDAHAFESIESLAEFVVAVDDDPALAAPYLRASPRPRVDLADVSGRICDFFGLVTSHERTVRASVWRPFELSLRQGVPAIAHRALLSAKYRSRRLRGEG